MSVDPRSEGAGGMTGLTAGDVAEEGRTPLPGEEGRATAFTCPDCGGTLYVGEVRGGERFRCRVGHAYSAEGLMLGKQQAIEAALWAAIVALEEKSDLARRIVKRLEETGRTSRVAAYESVVATSERHAELLRDTVEDLITASPTVFEEESAGGRGSP